MPNLALAPVFRIEDRKAILTRIQDALCADRDCRYDFKGAYHLTPDEIGNWAARQDVLKAKLSFPATEVTPPVTEIETPHSETIDQPTEA